MGILITSCGMNLFFLSGYLFMRIYIRPKMRTVEGRTYFISRRLDLEESQKTILRKAIQKNQREEKKTLESFQEEAAEMRRLLASREPDYKRLKVLMRLYAEKRKAGELKRLESTLHVLRNLKREQRLKLLEFPFHPPLPLLDFLPPTLGAGNPGGVR